MILDGSKGDSGWYVWDCEACREIKRVLWVNDETNEYRQWTGRLNPSLTGPEIVVHRVRKIRIHPPSVILVNPKECPADEVERRAELVR
jgi:hypothetical protein